jgi:RNA polymerase sigma-70 factor (ECF subfamily)
VRTVPLRSGVWLHAPAREGTLTTMDARAVLDVLADERARFVRMARARVASEAEAEDVVQRALLRAADRASLLAEPARARAWFYRILRRTIVDHHRARLREVGGDALDDIAAAEDPPAAPTCRCAVHLLGDLRPSYAEILRRIDYAGEEPAAAAAALGVTATNLYVRLHRARHALRERVEQHCGVSALAPCLACNCHGAARCGA